MRLNLQDRFWFVHIPFSSTVKFESLAQFPVDYFSHPVMPNLYSFSVCFFAFGY